ncbi:MAG: thioredoxin family protein [Bacteroidales bacterium]|nr:thioredoxin family protein [Bacteroidales bacterium]
MEIKILGPGCPNCITLEKLVRNVVAELDIKADIIKVTDILEIMSLGIISTPGLIINDKIVLKGRLPSVDEVKTIISANSLG